MVKSSTIKPEILIQALKEKRRMRESVPETRLFSLGVDSVELGSPSVSSKVVGRI
jgi:hypothetical protein